MKKIAFSCGLLGLAATPLFADEILTYRGDEIVVTATRMPQPADSALNNVTVVSREELAKSGQSTLAEVLQTLPGVEITANGGLGSTNTIMLRGANANHTLVLVDGMRVGSATFGLTEIENIPPDMIERIEVLRGPAGGMYGADAVGGVIQIFTRSGKGEPRPNFSIGAGTYNLRTASAGYGGQSGDTSFHIQGGYTETDGFSAANPKARFNAFNPDRDGYRDSRLTAQVERALSEDHQLGATLFHSDGTVHFDQGPTSDDVTQTVLDSYTVYSRNRLAAGWESLLRYGYSVDDATTWGLNSSVFRTSQSMLTWQNDIQVAGGTAMAGAEYLEQKVTGTTAFDKDKRIVTSLMGGYHGAFGAHSIQLNVRHDDNSQFGSQNTGSASYGYSLGAGWRASATLGKSFKAPTFNDLYFPFTDFGWGYTYQGNPNLKPETSFSRELRMSYRNLGQSADITYFENRIDNLIVASNGTATDGPANLGVANIRGVEMSYGGMIGATKLGANLTLQSPKANPSGLLLPHRAEQHGTIKLERRWAGWMVGGETVFAGRRYDDPANTLRLAGYGIVNLYAKYALNKEWTLSSRINNLFDKDYALAYGFNTPRANLFISLNYQPR